MATKSLGGNGLSTGLLKPGISRRLALAVLATVCAGRASSALGQTLTDAPTFNTQNQSLFGSGKAPGINYSNFLGVQWNTGNTQLINIGNSNGGNGVTINGETSGQIGLQYGLSVDSGSINASLPYTVTTTLPTLAALNTGNFVVGTNAVLNQNAANFTTSSPNFSFYADLVFDAEASINGTGSVNLLGFNTQGNFSAQLINVNTSLEVLALNRDNDGEARLLPDLFAAGNQAGATYNSVAATQQLATQINQTTGKRNKVNLALSTPSFGFGPVGPLLSASVNLPYIATQGAVTSPNTLSATGSDGFASVSLDVDGLLSKLIPNFPPLSVGANLDFVAGAISGSLDVADVKFTPTLNLDQQANLTAASVTANYNFGMPEKVTVLNANGSTAVAAQTVSSISITAGQQLAFTGVSASDLKTGLDLTPTYTANANLESEFGLSLSNALTASLLSGSFSAELFGVELADLGFGPLFTTTADLGTAGLGSLFDQKFALNGFNSATGETIQLTTAANQFDGGAGTTNWTTGTNWSVNNSVPQVGQDVTIMGTAAKPVTVNLTNSTGNAGDLTVGPAATLALSNSTLNISGANIEVTPDSTFSVISSNLNLTNTNTTIAGAGITLQNSILNATAQGNAIANLQLATTTLQGSANITVEGNLTMDNSTISANLSGQNINLSVNTITHLANGGVPNTLQAINGGNMFLKLLTGTGTSGYYPAIIQSGSVASEQLSLFAGNGSAIFIIPNTNSPNSEPIAILNSVSFNSSGNGGIQIRRNVDLVNCTNNGLLNLGPTNDSAINNFSVYFDQGAFTNNGQVIGGPTALLYVATGDTATLTGAGTLFFQTRFDKQTDFAATTTLINGAGHTIQTNGNNGSLAGIDNGGNLNVVNNGSIIVGSGGDSLQIGTGAATALFTNNGTVTANPTPGTGSGYTGLYIWGTATNNGVFTANGSSLSMGPDPITAFQRYANLTNLTGPANQTVLTGGTYTLANVNSTMNLFTAAPVNTQEFVNNANIQILGDGSVDNNPASGFMIEGTDISSFSKFTNTSAGTLVIGANRQFGNANIQNSGTIIMQGGGATLGNVTNLAGGLIQAVEGNTSTNQYVKLTADGTGTSTNYGTIQVTNDLTKSGVIDLNLQSTQAGGGKFNNAGTVEADNTDLYFNNMTVSNLVLLGGTTPTLQGGNWVVNGTNSASPGRIFLLAPPGAGLASALAANVTLNGNYSQLNIGNFLFENTINTITSTGNLNVQNRTLSFSQALTVNTGGSLSLTNASVTTLNGNLTNAGVISGYGSISASAAGVIANSGVVSANGGELALNDTVNDSNGTVQAVNTGVLRLNGFNLNAKTLSVAAGGGLLGYGTINAATFTNSGEVSPQNGQLTVNFGPSNIITNPGDMIANSGATLNLNGTGVFNNTNGTLRALDNGGDPTSNDGPATGGTIMLNGATVSGGTVSSIGANAYIKGYGTITNADIELDKSTLSVPSNSMVLAPGVMPANLIDSLIQGTNGGDVVFSNGTYSLYGSTIQASGAGSVINIAVNSNLTSGTLSNINGGAIQITGGGGNPAVLNQIIVSPQSTVQVNVGATVNLTGTYDQQGATLLMAPDSGLNLNGNIVGGNITIYNGAVLGVAGTSLMTGVNVVNNGGVQVNGNLTLNISTDGATTAASFVNSGIVNVLGSMTVKNQLMTDYANVTIVSGGSLTVPAYNQISGLTTINGVMTAGTFTLTGGTLKGSGRLAGKLIAPAGVVAPGNSPGTLTVDGDVEIDPAAVLDMVIADETHYDEIVSTNGNITLDGVIDIDFSEDTSDEIAEDRFTRLTIPLFQVGPGEQIIDNNAQFDFLGQLYSTDAVFDPATGDITMDVVPEPGTLSLLGGASLLLLRRRRR